MSPSQSLRAALTCFALAGVCALLLWSCCGCASHVPYTAADWAALTCAVAGQGADAWTTEQVLDAGGYECNPVYGRHPSDGRLILTKAVGILVAVGLGELQPRWRQWLFGLLGVSGGAAAVHNWREY